MIIDISQLDWMLRGYCSVMQANPDIFYEDGNEETAKAFCHQCPVINTCWEWAMRNDEEGVWGGTSAADRRAILRGGQRASCPSCRSLNLFQDSNTQICLACGTSWR
jgi:WhiB family redox-sensing transcriptional regulator